MRSAILLGAFAPFIVAAETPRLAVEDGTKITKSYENNIDFKLVDVTVEFDGEVQEGGEVPEVEINDTEEITFVDEYVSVKDGQAMEIVRTYETLIDISSQSQPTPDGEIEEETREGESGLDGAAVRFKWNEEDEAYDITFADEDDEGDEDLLEGLLAEADYLFLLPEDKEEELEVGDSWELEAIVFDLISTPSGDLKIDSDEDDEESDFEDQFRDNLSGTINATLKSIEDGVATITLEGDIETLVEDNEVDPEAPEGLVMEQTYSFEFTTEGELLWDMENGVAKSLKFGGDVAMTIDVFQSFNEQELKLKQSFEGEFSSTATFE